MWCPKYRKKIFEPVEVRERAKQMVGEICEVHGFEILEMEIMEDHLHLLLSFSPSRSIGEVVVNRHANVYQLWESKSVPPCLMEALSH